MLKSVKQRGKFKGWMTVGGIFVAVWLVLGLAVNPVQAADPTFSLAPLNPTVASGSVVELSAWLSEAGNEARDVTVYASFSQTDPLGTISGTSYQAGQAGVWTITARYGDQTASTSVTVTAGPINHLVINPNSQPEVLALNASRAFTATGFDAQNNVISPLRVDWTLAGLVGTIDGSGKLSATNAGTGKITAQANGVSASVDVLVRSTAASNVNQANANVSAATANANANTNASAVNESTNSQPDNVSGEAVPTETDASDACTALAWWWLIFLIVYLGVLYGYYFLIRGVRSRWWWTAPLLLTIAAVWIYFGARCEPVATWFPWVTVIGGLILTVFRPMRFNPTDGHPV